MPQLNIYTYLSQATWLIIIFSLYYIYMKQIVLTSIFEKLKLRSSILPSSDSSAQSTNTSISYGNGYLN